MKAFFLSQNKKLHRLYLACLKINQENLEQEFSGILEAMEVFAINKAQIITIDQSDSFGKNGKTIQLIPFYQWATQTDLLNSIIRQLGNSTIGQLGNSTIGQLGNSII